MADYRSARSTHILESHLAAGADHGTRILTAANGDSLAQNVPLLYDADGNVISTATRTGNTTNYATATAGGKTTNYVAVWDSNDNLSEVDPSTLGGGSSGDPAGLWAATAPPTTGWSWVNQGTSSVEQNAFGSITLIPQTQSGFQCRMYVRSVPGGSTWRVRMLMAHYPADSGSSLQGWCLRESSTGKIVSYELAHDVATLGTQWTNESTFNANYAPRHSMDFLYWWEIDWQSTNRVIRMSRSGFQNAGDLKVFHSVAKNDFATTAFDQIGIFSADNASRSDPPAVTLVSYEEF